MEKRQSVTSASATRVSLREVHLTRAEMIRFDVCITLIRIQQCFARGRYNCPPEGSIDSNEQRRFRHFGGISGAIICEARRDVPPHVCADSPADF
jgi:hypothetical protein